MTTNHDLAHWQRQDHRFLLPKHSGEVGILRDGASDEDLNQLLASRPGLIYAEVNRARRPRRASSLPRLLATAGYGEQRWYWIAPNLIDRREYVPLEDPVAIRALLGRREADRGNRAKAYAARAAAAAGVMHHVVPALAVVASRSGHSVEPQLSAHLQSLDSEVSSVFLLTPGFPGSRYAVALGHDANARLRLVAKAARVPGASAALAHEARALQMIHGLNIPELHAPGFVSLTRVGASDVLTQTAVDGAPIGPGVVRTDPSVRTQLLALVGRFPVTGTLTAATLADLVAPVEVLAGGRERTETTLLARATLRLVEGLDTRGIPHVVEHGDLSHPNLLRGADGIGLVDWERSERLGLPGHDLVIAAEYLTSARATTSSVRPTAFHTAMWRQDGWARAALLDELRSRGVATDLMPALVALTWARVVAHEAAKHPDQGLHKALVTRHEQALWSQALTEAHAR